MMTRTESSTELRKHYNKFITVPSLQSWAMSCSPLEMFRNAVIATSKCILGTRKLHSGVGMERLVVMQCQNEGTIEHDWLTPVWDTTTNDKIGR